MLSQQCSNPGELTYVAYRETFSSFDPLRQTSIISDKMIWKLIIVVVLLIVEIEAQDDTQWKFKVEYDTPFNITCTHGTTEMMSATTMRWILPNGDMVEMSSPQHDRVELHMAGKLLRLKHVDDEDFGNYFCLRYDDANGEYSVVKKGINIDGPYWGDLNAKYRDGIIIGSIAAAIVFVLMIGICYLFERNPVLIGRDSKVMGDFVPKNDMEKEKHEVQTYDNAAIEMEHEIKKPDISNGNFVEVNVTDEDPNTHL